MYPHIPSPLWGRFSRVRGPVERHSSSRFVDMRAAIVRSGASAMAIAFPNGASLINTQYKSQMQMPENLTDVTSPSTTKKISLLLDLPIEIQIDIIELLQRDWHSQPYALKSLRLTCKQLEALCNPVFAESICIRLLDRSALELRNEFAPKFAKYLKVMACHIPEHGGEVELFMESVLTTILERAVHLRKITLNFCSTDTRAHSQLLNAIGNLGALEDVGIWEYDYPQRRPPYDTVQFSFHHRLLNRIIDCHSQRLRVLVVSGRTPMHESTFLKLRDTASQLRRLSISRCLTIETRGAFAEPQKWACSGRLEYLFIHQCAIHSATIARHIAAGVFGPLHTFYIFGCRENSGDSLELAATVWTIPPLHWVRVDQLNDVEMSTLRCIRAKKVYTRMVWSNRPQCIEVFGRSTTFPEAVELHVEKDWDNKDFEELKRSCAMRGLTKVERDLYPLN